MNMQTWTNKIPPARKEELILFFHSALFDDIVPFWEKYSLDNEFGGYLTRLERDGNPYSGDKDMWMTGREIWMFSHLYNQYKPESRWKDSARLGLEFLSKFGFKDDEKMYFRLDRQGNPIASSLSLFTKVFASIGMAEYWQIENDSDLKNKAEILYQQMMQKFGLPSDTPMLGYPMNAEFHLHSHDMCKLTVAWVFNSIWPDPQYEQDCADAITSILNLHWKPQEKVLYENVAMDGTPLLQYPEGRLYHPGHSIESSWMMMEFADKNKDETLLQTAIDILLASLEQGWDKEFGGIRYLTNVDWTPCHSLEADLKLWWPHSEALYALMLAWALTGRQDISNWYTKVHDYTFSHFPDPEYGEWFGYLNRDGSPVWTAKANGWKGFFHTPRALFRCYQLLNK